MSRRDDTIALLHMRDHAAEAAEMARTKSRADLDSDRMLSLALTKMFNQFTRYEDEFRDWLRNRTPGHRDDSYRYVNHLTSPAGGPPSCHCTPAPDVL